jgi:hypothetical protein
MTDAPGFRQDNDRPHTRRMFVRDVLILQVKLLLGNLHNFVLIPATLGAAALDLVVKTGPHGSRFYRVLDWGRRAEDAIDLYGALDHLHPETDEPPAGGRPADNVMLESLKPQAGEELP